MISAPEKKAPEREPSEEQPRRRAPLGDFRWGLVDDPLPILKPSRYQRIFDFLFEYNRY